MTESTISFTKTANGYAVEEVDQYIEMLQQSYEQTVTAGRMCESKSVKMKGELEQANAEKQKLTEELQKTKEKTYAALQNLQEEVERLNEYASKKDGEIQKLEVQLRETQRKAKSCEELNVKIEEQQEELLRMTRTLEDARERERKFKEEQQLPSDRFAEIFLIAQNAADEYVEKRQTQMDELLEESRFQADEQMEQAEKRAESIVEAAKSQAEKILSAAEEQRDEMLNEAENKVQYAKHKAEKLEANTQQSVKAMMEKAKAEYANIRALIQTSSEEYMALCKKITHGEENSVSEIEETFDLEKPKH